MLSLCGGAEMKKASPTPREGGADTYTHQGAPKTRLDTAPILMLQPCLTVSRLLSSPGAASQHLRGSRKISSSAPQRSIASHHCHSSKSLLTLQRLMILYLPRQRTSPLPHTSKPIIVKRENNPSARLASTPARCLDPGTSRRLNTISKRPVGGSGEHRQWHS